jgi:hypothetical protein
MGNKAEARGATHDEASCAATIIKNSLDEEVADLVFARGISIVCQGLKNLTECF